MEGRIVEVRQVLNMLNQPLSTTVIYERDGKQYAGRQWTTQRPGGEVIEYYFGGAAKLPNLTDIDAAWAQAYRLSVRPCA